MQRILLPRMKSEKTWTILLVDDDATTTFLNELFIKDVAEGVKTVSFNTAVKTLKYLSEFSESSTFPQNILIFLDLNMPGMDGFELLDELKQRPFKGLELDIILLSSSINIRDQVRAEQYTLYGYLEKPLSHQKLKVIFQDLGVA